MTLSGYSYLPWLLWYHCSWIPFFLATAQIPVSFFSVIFRSSSCCVFSFSLYKLSFGSHTLIYLCPLKLPDRSGPKRHWQDMRGRKESRAFIPLTPSILRYCLIMPALFLWSRFCQGDLFPWLYLLSSSNNTMELLVSRWIEHARQNFWLLFKTDILVYV